ncbi:MAG: DUF1573 domain-containing protein [Mucinivorans sp.]
MKFFVKALPIGLFCLSALVGHGKGLEISTNQLDFGTITKQTLRTVMVYNRTPMAQVIIAATTDCNCTKVDYSHRPIKSGDSTLVRITYSPKDKGAFYKGVTLRNSTNADLKFVVRGTVK